MGNQRLKAAFMKIDLIKADYNPKLCDGKYKYNIYIYLRKLRVSVHGLAGILVPLYLYFTPSSPYAVIV